MTLAQTIDLTFLIEQRKPKLDVDAMVEKARITAKERGVSTAVALLRLAWGKGIEIMPDEVKPAITMPEGFMGCPQHAKTSKMAPQATLDALWED